DQPATHLVHHVVDGRVARGGIHASDGAAGQGEADGLQETVIVQAGCGGVDDERRLCGGERTERVRGQRQHAQPCGFERCTPSIVERVSVGEERDGGGHGYLPREAGRRDLPQVALRLNPRRPPGGGGRFR